MALLKLICNSGAKLFVDQEFVSELQENKLYITELSVGMYLVDVVSLIDDQIQVSFELSFDNDNQQILKRIDLAEQEKKSKQLELKSLLMGNPNLSFYRNLARFEYNGLWGYVDNNYEIVVEPIYSSAEDFVNAFALVGKSFSEGIKYALIDTTGKNRMGVWFDDLIFRDEKRLFVRRNNDLLSYDVSQGTLFTYNLVGEIKDDNLIPVLWENNYSKKGGYINSRGEVVLPFIYDHVTNFNEDGLAEVERFGFKRYITKDGDVCLFNTVYEILRNKYYDQGNHLFLLDKQFDWCGPLETSHRDSLFLYETYRMAVKKGEKWGYYRFKEREKENCLEEMFPCKYDEPLSDSQYNFVVMRDGKDCCVVNLVDVKYKGGDKDGQYVYGEVGRELFRTEAEQIYPIIELEYHFVSGDPWRGMVERDLYLFRFNNIVVKMNGKYGVFNNINRSYVLPCEYNDIFWLDNNYPENSRLHVFYGKENYIVEKSGTYELINDKGSVISNLNATEISHVGNFWVIRLRNDQNHYRLYSIEKGLFNYLFDEITPYQYHSEFGKEFYHYYIKKDNKLGVVSNEGELEIDCLYDRIDNNTIHYSGYFRVNREGKYGYYIHGNKVLDCVYDTIIEDAISYGIDSFIVERDNKKALVIKDKFITSLEHDSITINDIETFLREDIDSQIKEYGGFDRLCSLSRRDLYEVVLDNKKHGLVDDNGNIILDMVYDHLFVEEMRIDNETIKVITWKNGKSMVHELTI